MLAYYKYCHLTFAQNRTLSTAYSFFYVRPLVALPLGVWEEGVFGYSKVKKLVLKWSHVQSNVKDMKSYIQSTGLEEKKKKRMVRKQSSMIRRGGRRRKRRWRRKKQQEKMNFRTSCKSNQSISVLVKRLISISCRPRPTLQIGA